MPFLMAEENIIVLTTLERRIEVGQIDRLVSDVSPQDVEVIPVVEAVHGATGQITRAFTPDPCAPTTRRDP